MISIFGGSGFIGNKLSEMLTKESLTFEILDKKSNPKYKEITKFCDVSDLSTIKNSFKVQPKSMIPQKSNQNQEFL